MTDKPAILVLLKTELVDLLFPGTLSDDLRAVGAVEFYDYTASPLTTEALAAQIGPYDMVVTGWGMPFFTAEVLAAAQRLKLIAHATGTVKHFLSEAIFDTPVAVTHAAAAMALSVAEMSVLSVMMGLRRVHWLDRQMRAGADWSIRHTHYGHDLARQRIGVVGAGYTGRHTIKLLNALEADVWVYDPYLSAQEAKMLHVQLADLDTLLRTCRAITLQAPSTEETYHMIGARELALLPDGALLVNTARSWLIDMDALLHELQSGRIWAALDVFDEEPLPLDSPFRQLENAVITPHVGSWTHETLVRHGQITLDEIRRFVAGKPLVYQITREQWSIMA